MVVFLWGALAMASATAAAFFMRFYLKDRERLFLLFSMAFAVLAAQWFVLGIERPPAEARHYVYLLRLAAFLLIILAIVDKNRSASRARISGRSAAGRRKG
jgi:hypothetical protein